MVSARPSAAVNLTLTNGNSQAVFDNATGTGFASWTIDGIEQINNVSAAGQTATYFRIGDSTGQTLIEEFSASLTENVVGLSSDSATLRYTDTNNDFTIDLDLVLRGGSVGSGKGDLSQTITVTNTSATPLDFRLFQYNDLNVNGVATPNKLSIDGATFTAVQKTPFGKKIGTTVTTIPFAAVASVVPDLVDFSPTAINNTIDSPINLSGASSLNNEDVSFAYQWNVNLAAGQSFVVNQTSSVIPEPTSVSVLILLGTLGMKLRRKNNQ